MYLLERSFWRHLLSFDVDGGAGFSVAIFAVILTWIAFDRLGR